MLNQEDMANITFMQLAFFISTADILGGVFAKTCIGPRGEDGDKGEKGYIGSGTQDDWYSVTPARNWRECVWYAASGSDSGTIYTCTFTKESSSTALYVAYGGCTRLCCCHGCCGRWYITFNGAECSNPQVIDGTVYMAHYSGADLHRHRTISGVCLGISAGSVSVAINVGACSGYGYYDLYTGWNSVSRLYIEEWPASPY